jgi:hypothetical protein
MRTYAFKALALLFSVIAGTELFLWQQARAPLPDPEARPLQTWSADVSAGGAGDAAAAQATDFSAIDARPLFAPTRRPFVAPQPDAPQITDTPDEPLPEPAPEVVSEPVPETEPAPVVDPAGFQLKGILVAGAKRTSLIVSPDNATGQWLSVGAQVMGWTIAEIGDDRLVLKNGDQSHTLKQYVDNPQSPLGGQTPAE